MRNAQTKQKLAMAFMARHTSNGERKSLHILHCPSATISLSAEMFRYLHQPLKLVFLVIQVVDLQNKNVGDMFLTVENIYRKKDGSA